MPKKHLQKELTLNNFEKRIQKVIADEITSIDREELNGAYLSTYECYSTIEEDLPNSHHTCNSAVVLMCEFLGVWVSISKV